MKRISILFVFLLIISLIGCAAQPEASSTVANSPAPTPSAPSAETVWYRNMKLSAETQWCTPVIETDTCFYYISEYGVYEYAKDIRQIRKIVPDAALGLYMYEGSLYYSTEHEVNCMDLDTGNVSLVWDKTMLETVDTLFYFAVCDFALCDGYLYIAGTGTSFLRVNLENCAVEQFLGDCSSMVLCENDCYYLDHAERTFSLYRMDCDSKESTLLRGTGQPEPGRDALRIDGIAGITDSVAYSVRDASDVYLYHPDGSDEKIFDGDDSDQFWLFFVRRCPASKLYFYTTDGTQLKLYEYRPAAGVELLASIDYTARMCDIVITESAIFWWSEAEQQFNCLAKESA